MVLCLSKPMRDPLAQIVSSDNAGLMKNQGQLEIAGCLHLSDRPISKGTGTGLGGRARERRGEPDLASYPMLA